MHRLRGEVARLRSETADRRRLPAQSPQAPGPGRQSAQNKLLEFTPVDLWSDAGTSTPEASVETLLWVLRTGDEDRLREMIQWQVTPDVNLNAVERGTIDSMRQAVGEMQGGRISRTEPLGKNGVKIQFEATQTDGKAVPHEIIFARQDTGWKVTVSFLEEDNPTGGSRIRRIIPFVSEQLASTQ